MTDLLEAVDALTKEKRTKVFQDDGTVAIVVHDPLLRQLKDAVTSAIGSGGGGGTATGSVLNDEALYRASIINAAIQSWCRMRGVTVSRDMVVDLRRWHSAFLSSSAEPDFYIDQMRGWARTIRDLLDPPERVPLEPPCPMCGARTWPDTEGREVLFPLLVTYRNEGESVVDERALCRACQFVWDGQMELRKLRWDIGIQEEA